MMSKLRFTSRGKAAGLISASVIALGVATGDALMGLAGALVPFAMAADLVALKAREGGLAGARVRMGAGIGQDYGEDEAAGSGAGQAGSGGAREARIIAGERFSATGILKAACAIGRLRASAPFTASCERVQGGRAGGFYAVTVQAQPSVFGRYSAGSLEADVGSPLGLYSSEVAVGMDPVAVAAFPRFYPGLVRALGLLEGGLAGEGSAAQGLRARPSRRGDEYAWTREYVPGDPDRFIDWKATARRARLCVKEFHEEQGGGAMVFFDGRAPGAVSADEMARDLLSVCAGLGGEGRDACFVSGGAGSRGDEGENDGASEGRDAGSTGKASVVDRAGPGELLRIAVAKALEMASSAGGRGEGWEGGAYALMPPKVRSAVMEIIRKGHRDVAAVEEGDAYAEALRRMRDVPASLAYVGCPIYEPERALALVDAAACGAGGQATALMPERPWLDARTVEGAYEMRESYLRIAGRVRDAAAGGAGKGCLHEGYSAFIGRGAAGTGADANATGFSAAGTA
jgi:hypothetical protein